jgi:hypothetical protein
VPVIIKLSKSFFMAKMTSLMGFTGRLGNLSFYTKRGSDKIIVRSKGGPSKRKIKTGRSFVKVRQNNMEFGGRSACVKQLNRVLHALKPLADINIASAFSSMLTATQEMDKINPKGKRSVLLSRLPQSIEDFNFNSKNNLSSIIRSPLIHNLSRETLTTSVGIPALLPGINFFVADKYPLFSLVAVLGVVPDLHCNGKYYEPTIDTSQFMCYNKVETPWLPSMDGAAATTLNIPIQQLPPGNEWSLILAIGIRFATIGTGGAPQQIKYSGAAKIIGVR